jgi:LmbE family N-acetylglucosaminyl deacetylase
MKYVFISPHIDDAILSLGGLIIQLKNEQRDVDIEYVFTISNWTNPESICQKDYGNDPGVISRIRKEEERLIGNELQYGYRFMDYPDLPLRKGMDSKEEEGIFASIKDMLSQMMNMEDCYFFPLGLGHPDHELIRDIGIELIKKKYNVLFYEDMPYLAYQFTPKSDFYNLMKQRDLVPQHCFIDFDRKRSLLLKYTSQMSNLWLKDIMNYSYSIRDNAYLERWWKPASI